MAVVSRPFERAQAKVTSSLHLTPVLLVAVAAIAVVALLRVVQTSDATTTSFSIQRLQETKRELEANVSQVEAEVASLASLSRIEQEARRLGLQAPKGRQSVEVNVPWPAEEEGLPTRFAPGDEAEVSEQGSSWWRDLLELVPFY